MSECVLICIITQVSQFYENLELTKFHLTGEFNNFPHCWDQMMILQNPLKIPTVKPAIICDLKEAASGTWLLALRLWASLIFTWWMKRVYEAMMKDLPWEIFCLLESWRILTKVLASPTSGQFVELSRCT